jgi:hypothetical protein
MSSRHHIIFAALGMGTRLWQVVAALATGIICVGDPLDTWTWRNPSPSSENFQAVAFANGTFVAVGNLGSIVTSTNGTEWTTRSLPDTATELTDHTRFGIAYGGGRFVTVGLLDAFYSSDGQAWVRSETTDPSARASRLYGACYGAGRFVGVGQNRTYTSSDGAIWTPSGLDNFGALRLTSVAYGMERFIATGADGRLYTSTDGSVWTYAKSTEGPPLYGVAQGNDRWVAVGDLGTILTSTNGLKWTATPSPTTALLINVVFANGLFHAVGGVEPPATEQGLLFTSEDGIQWESQPVNAPYLLTGVAAGLGRTVAVGYRGVIRASEGAAGWTPQDTVVTRRDLYDIIRARNEFYAVGGYSDPNEFGRFRYTIVTSPDGRNWSQRIEGNDARLSGICEGKGLLVAVGTQAPGDNGEVIMTSTDGFVWSRLDLDQQQGLNAVAFGNGRFVATGTRTLYSNNGTNWFPASTGPSYASFLGFTGGKFFADNNNGVVGLRVSNDGINWRSAGLPARVAGVAWFKDQFIASGLQEAYGIYLSTNGTVWQKVAPSVMPAVPPVGGESVRDFVGRITYADGQLVAGGRFLGGRSESLSSLYTSTDGTNWLRRFNQSSKFIGRVAFGAGTFVGVGGGGIILQSGILPAAPTSISRIVVSGNVTLELSGPVGRDCRVEFSDMLDAPFAWTPLTTVTIPDSPFVVSDDNGAGRPSRYYQTVTLP